MTSLSQTGRLQQFLQKSYINVTFHIEMSVGVAAQLGSAPFGKKVTW